METEKTMEQLIEDAERRGWRVSNLSHIRGPNRYSCILERKKVGEDGFPVYASSDLVSTPKEALRAAWSNAQRPVDNPRVGARRAAASKPSPSPETLAGWLRANLGYSVRLENALHDLQKAHTGDFVEDDGEW